MVFTACGGDQYARLLAILRDSFAPSVEIGEFDFRFPASFFDRYPEQICRSGLGFPVTYFVEVVASEVQLGLPFVTALRKG